MTKRPDEPMTVHEAAELSQTPILDLYAKIQRGEVPTLKQGWKTLIERDVVKQLVANKIE